MGRQALAVQQNVFLRPPAVATPISVVPTMQKINFQSPVDVQDLRIYGVGLQRLAASVTLLDRDFSEIPCSVVHVSDSTIVLRIHAQVREHALCSGADYNAGVCSSGCHGTPCWRTIRSCASAFFAVIHPSASGHAGFRSACVMVVPDTSMRKWRQQPVHVCHFTRDAALAA